MTTVCFSIPNNVYTPDILGRISGFVLTQDQLRTYKVYPGAAFTTFSVEEVTDVMSLLKQFVDEGFELETDFQHIAILRSPR